jgi:hypothetical protein
MFIIEIIKDIKFKRLSPYEKIIYMIDNTKIVTNDPQGSEIKFFVSPENDVLVEVYDENFLFRFNYDLIWIPYYEDIWSKHKVNKINILLYLAERINMEHSINKYEIIGGVSVKYLPYDKIGDNQRYV